MRFDRWSAEDCRALMYVIYKMYSDAPMQLTLHKKTRVKIREWEERGYLPECGAELTYHPSVVSHPSYLQAVLNMSKFIDSEEEKELTQEAIEQIPEEIRKYFESLAREDQIWLSVGNHLLEIKEGLPKKRILEIDTNGTRIALGILSMLEKDRSHFKDDPELKRHIYEQIRQELGAGSKLDLDTFLYARHETLNTLGIWGAYSKNLLLPDEEQMFVCSTGTDGLELIKARSLDCRMVFSSWKNNFLD